jgi:hypothetical protein
MKDNLEKAFKEKLDQFEAPYDATAWESMNSRLDAQQGTGGSNLMQWILGSAAVAVVLSIAIYYFNNDQNTNDVLNAGNDTTETKDNTKFDNPVTNSSEKKSPDLKVTPKDDIDNNQLSPNTEEVVPTADNVIQPINGLSDDEKAIEASNSPQHNEISPVDASDNIQSIDDGSEYPKYNFITGTLLNKKICKGESIFIRNAGAKNDIIKMQINDDVFRLKKANAYQYTPEHSGTILFLDGENNVIGKEKFIVLDNPTPEFNLKANIFEDGLPITNCETYGDYASIEWTFDEENKASGRKVTHNFFKKGEHDITLSVTDFNGCKNSLTKLVRIEENYNLMAVDAFKPHGADPRNKVFMPFALTQRDVNFTLTIVDPRDNSVIFTSQDATKGWDGNDQRTGKMTPGETVYIWKVQLENSLPNERQVYAGTVVHN